MTDRKFTPPTNFPAKYVTRDGQEAVVEKTFEEGPYHLRGKVGCKSRSWMRSGAYWLDGDDHAYDLFDLPEEQPIEERYPVGVWHGWTGGECPLPEGTDYEWRDQDDDVWESASADGAHWSGDALRGLNLIAFCVTSYPKPEPKTVEKWINMYEGGEIGYLCRSHEVADDEPATLLFSSKTRTARKRITITEGEWDQ
jgi:hypothetical protein